MACVACVGVTPREVRRRFLPVTDTSGLRWIGAAQSDVRAVIWGMSAGGCPGGAFIPGCVEVVVPPLILPISQQDEPRSVIFSRHS